MVLKIKSNFLYKMYMHMCAGAYRIVLDPLELESQATMRHINMQDEL